MSERRLSMPLVLLLILLKVCSITGMATWGKPASVYDGRIKISRDEVLCEIKTRMPLFKVLSVINSEDNLESTARMFQWVDSRPSCAVVSNSGVLAKHDFGSEIDSADVVMRFNDAPVEGYEKQVGSKETVRFVNMHWASA
eukprot:6467992-Amphidinium_carterae.1